MATEQTTALATTTGGGWLPLAEIKELAKAVVASGLFPAFRNEAAAIVLMTMAQIEGCHPMQAVMRYHVIDGKPAKQAAAIAADFTQRGGKLNWLKISPTEVTLELHSKNLVKPVTVTWTIERARIAGLTGKPNWKNHPENMMIARCLSEGGRIADPAIVAGLYTPDEVEEFADDRQPATVIDLRSVAIPAELSQPTPAPAPAGPPAVPPVVDVVATPTPAPAPAEATAPSPAPTTAAAPPALSPVAAVAPLVLEPTKGTPASREQIRALCTIMDKLGIKDRSDVLATVKGWCGRKVASRNELTASEAAACIDAAKAMEAHTENGGQPGGKAA